MPRKTVKYLPVVCAVMVLILLAYMYTGSVGEFKSSDFRLRSAESTDYRTILERLNNNDKVAQDDPRLIKVIREYYIEPPSRLPYNLEDENIQDYSQAGQSQVVDKLLNKQEGGFFVECGALSGERISNSLFFEKTRHWSGLLIEADPMSYAILKAKNRKAFTINACLSVYPYPVKMPFNQRRDNGRLLHNQEARDWIAQSGIPKNETQVQCFPLYSILLALNQTKVDYFSLDIEGDELYALRTIPFDSVDIDLMTVEVNQQTDSGSELRSFLGSKGYKEIQKVHADIIFRKKHE